MLPQRQILNLASASDQKLSQQITIWHLCIFAATLLFDKYYSQIVLFSFGFHVLIHLNKSKLKWLSYETVFLSSLYIFTLIATLYSTDKKEASGFIERQLALLLFPLALTLTRDQIKHHRKIVLAVFSWTCLLVIIVLFIRIFVIIYRFDLGLNSLWNEKFTNHHFSSVIGLHATYLSMYLFIAVMFFIDQFFSTSKISYKVLYITAGVISLFGFLQLFSRSACIALLVTLVFIVPLYFIEKKYRLVYILSSLVCIAVAVFFIFKKGELKERYIEDFKDDLSSNISVDKAVEPRAVRWDCALDIFRESPVWGHGTGDEKSRLMAKYYERNLYIAYVNKLNAHNQYLSYMIKGGIIALFIFLAYLFAGFKKAVRSGDFIYLSFLILISVVSFSENILSVNKGIFFVAFFYTFFWLTKKVEPPNEHEASGLSNKPDLLNSIP